MKKRIYQNQSIPTSVCRYCYFIIIFRLIKGISFDYQEDSFRDLFKNCGEIKLFYIVHQNNGRCAGYGYYYKIQIYSSAIQFANQKGRKAALKLDGSSVGTDLQCHL